MKTKISVLLFLLLCSYYLLAQDQVDNDGRNETVSTITTANYCSFLNAVAATDPHHLYEEAAQQILRFGEPGNYYYEELSSEPNASMLFLNQDTARFFCDWQSALQTLPQKMEESDHLENDDSDPELQSNITYFSLLDDSMIEPKNNEEASSSWQQAIKNISFAATLLVGGERMQPSQERILLSEHNALREKTKNAIDEQTQRPSTHLETEYQEADRCWDRYQEAWEKYPSSYQRLQESLKEVALSTQRLEAAQQATSDEEFQKNKLSKVSKYAAALGSLLGNVPEPNTQAVGIGAGVISEVAGVINHLWGAIKVMKATRNKDQAIQNNKKIKEDLTLLEREISKSEQEANRAELEIATKEQQKTMRHAAQLSPQEWWQAVQWQEWANPLSSSEEEKVLLAGLASDSFSWAEGKTLEAWKRRINESEEELKKLAQQKKEVLAPLAKKDQQARKAFEQETQKVNRAYESLQQEENQQEVLKTSIENLTEEMSRLEQEDPASFETKKQEFCKTFQELQKVHQRVLQKTEAWEKALDLKKDAQMTLWSYSQAYRLAKEPRLRAYARVEAMLQGDKQALRASWPKENDEHDYKTWSLPLPVTAEEGETLEDSGEGIQQSIRAPEKSFQELEARGKALRLMQAYLPIAGSSTALSQETAVELPLSSKNQVMRWVNDSYHVKETTAQEEERWKAFQEKEKIKKQIRRTLKAWSKAKKKERQNIPGRERSDSLETLGTWVTEKTGYTRSSKPNTILTYGGLLKKRVEEPILEEEKSVEDYWSEFCQLQREQKEQEEKWSDLQKPAEQERLKQEGQKSFNSDEECQEAWQEADQKAIDQKKLQEKENRANEATQALHENWEKNKERWEARAKADQLLERRNQKREELARFLQASTTRSSKKNHAQEEEREKIDLEEKDLTQKTQEAEATWEELAQEYYSSIHSDQPREEELLREADQAVNRRYEELLKNYEQQDSSVHDEEKYDGQCHMVATLAKDLERDYQSSQVSRNSEEALVEYQRKVFKRALRYAQQESVGADDIMIQAWEAIVENSLPVAKKKIDQEALELFKREKERLERIERVFLEIIEARLSMAEEKILLAAKLYSEDPSLWYELSEQERRDYQNATEEKNSEYEEELTHREEVIYEYERILQDRSLAPDVRKDKEVWLIHLKKKQKEQEEDLHRGQVERQWRMAQEHFEQERQAKEKFQEAISEEEKKRWEKVLKTYEQIREHWENILDLEKSKSVDVVEEEHKALCYYEIAHLQQQSIELFAKSAEACAVGKTDEGVSWSSAGASFYYAAEELEKAIRAEEAGKTAVAKAWREAAALQQQSIELFTKAANAHAAGQIAEGESWHNAGLGFYLVAEKLEKAIEADEAGRSALAQAWRDAAALQQQSITFYAKAAKAYAKAAKAYAEGKINVGIAWNKAGRGFYWVAEKLGKAIEAEEAKKPAIAQAWREAAALQQQSITFYTKAANAHAAGQTAEGESWHNAGRCFYWVAEKLEKAIEAAEAGKSAVAQAWRKAAALQQQSITFYTKAAEAYTAGKTDEDVSWNNAGLGFFHTAEKLGKAIEAEEAGKPLVAQLWREAAALQQQSIELFINAANARAAWKTDEGKSWNNAGGGFYYAAEKLGKAIEAEEGGKPIVVVQAWRDAAALQQQSITFYTKAAEAYVAGKTNEGVSWNNTGSGFFHAAEKLVKAIKAEEAENPLVAKAWRDAVEKWKQVHACWKTTAEAIAARHWVTHESTAKAATAAAEEASQVAENLAQAQDKRWNERITTKERRERLLRRVQNRKFIEK